MGGLLVRDRKKTKKEENKQEVTQEKTETKAQGMTQVGFVYSSNLGKIDMERD